MLATMTRDNHDARQEAPTRKSALKAFYATKNPSKVKDSINDIRFFAKFCGCINEEQVEDLLLGPGSSREKTQGLVARYRDHLRSKNMAYGTINRRLAAVRTLVRMAKLIGMVTWEIDVPAGERTARRDTRVVSKRAVRVAGRMDGETLRPRRDRAIVLLAHHAQLTRAEIVGLLLEHYDPDPAGPSVAVGASRVALPKKIKQALDAWIEMRGFAGDTLFTREDRSTPMAKDEIIALVRPGSIASEPHDQDA